MKIIYNKIIPFKGFRAINLFGVLFARKNAYISKTTLNHEQIHSAQMKEMLWILFYLWYFIEWIINLFRFGFNKIAYRNIKFEKEAYLNQSNFDYLKNRKHYCWIKL